MWAKPLSITASLIQISSLLVENERKIEALQTQVTDLRADLKYLAQKFDHFTEMERIHHQKNLLELENRILQMERRLPSQKRREPKVHSAFLCNNSRGAAQKLARRKM